jgi:site-specific recombinase XerD
MCIEFTNIRNEFDLNAFRGKLYYKCVFTSFKYFLKKHKENFNINVCIQNVRQYIDWLLLNNMDTCKLDKESYSKYKFYLLDTKTYSKSTTTSNLVSLRKFNKFLIVFNKHSSSEEFYNHYKRTKSQYNYLTELYIRL